MKRIFVVALSLIPSFAFAQQVQPSPSAFWQMLSEALQRETFLHEQLLQEKARADAAEAKLKAAEKPAEPAKPAP